MNETESVARQQLLVLEPTISGHRIQFLELLVEALATIGGQALLVTDSKNSGNERLVNLVNRSSGGLTVKYCSGFDLAGVRVTRFWLLNKLTRITYNIRWWWAYRSAYKLGDLPAAEVYVPHGDLLTPSLWALGSPFGKARFSMLLMRVYYPYLLDGVRGYKFLLYRLQKCYVALGIKKKTLRTCFVNDPYFFDYPSHQGLLKAHGPSVKLLPDPASLPVRNKLPKNLGGPCAPVKILIIGAITERKGLDSATRMAANSEGRVELIVAGKQVGGSRRRIQKYLSRKHVSVIDRYLSSNDMAEFYASVDAVWVAYEHFYAMSGVLIDAVAAGLPVLAPKKGGISNIVKEYDLGVCIDPSQYHAFDRELLDGLNSKRLVVLERKGRVADLVNLHSPNSFKNILIRGLGLQND